MKATGLQYCIQCTDKRTGKVGDFIFKENEPLHSIGDSWFFDDIVEMYKHIKVMRMKTSGLGDFNLYMDFSAC